MEFFFNGVFLSDQKCCPKVDNQQNNKFIKIYAEQKIFIKLLKTFIDNNRQWKFAKILFYL